MPLLFSLGELFQFECAGVELIVGALFGDQFVVVAALDNVAVIQNHDAVGVHDGAEAVGDDEDRTALHQSVHAVLNQLLGTGIDGGGCFVQNHDRRIGHGRTGNGDQLTLALRKACAVAGELGVIALGQTGDEIVGIGQLGGLDALFICGIQLAVTDILHNGAGKQVGILQNHTQASAQVGLGDLVDVDVIVADLAVGDVIEPVDQIGDGGLAGTGSTDEGDLLTGTGIQGDVVEDGLFGNVAEVHILQGDIALQLGIGDGTLCCVGMLPCPAAGALFGLGDVAVFVDLGIDQLDIAFVLFRHLIHQIEDTLGACQSHNDGIHLAGDLVDGHCEVTGQVHKGDQVTQGQQAAVGADHQHTAHDGQHGILDIAQVVVDGAHHVGELTGGVGVGEESFVELVELVLADLFVVEDLDHLLAGDHFFDIAVDCAQGLLLAHEELARLAGQGHGDEHDGKDSDQSDDGQDPGGADHGDKDGNQGDHGGNSLGNGLGDHHTQGIGVAGEAGHDVACGVGVEIADGQFLHFCEHLITDGFLDTLGDTDHQILLQEVGYNTNHVNCDNEHEEGCKGIKIRGAVGYHGQDVFVNNAAQRGGCHNGGESVGKDTGNNDYQGNPVFFHVSQNPQQGLLGITGLHGPSGRHSMRRHYSSPPFC